MANTRNKVVVMFLLAGFVAGCASSVKVVKNPGEGDSGIRFYRPKPYLFVTPADPTGRMVNMKLMYLPDFNEEYSAHLKGKSSVALQDGWNLVGVNTKEAPAPKEEPAPKVDPALVLPNAVVAATNVPMGFYESVYSNNGSSKALKGWRYLGITVMGGNSGAICREPGHNPDCPGDKNGCITGPLYGLVFFNGVMTFRQLDEIANNQLCPMFVNPTGAAPGTASPPLGTGEVGPKPTELPKSSVGPGSSAPALPQTNPPTTSVPVPKTGKALATTAPSRDLRLLRSANSTLDVAPVRP